MSLLFLAVEGLAPQPGYVLVARVAMSALLLSVPALLARPLSPRLVHAIVYAVAAGVCLCFATIAWGTGGTLSPYFAFLPMLALVFTIAVPDAPVGSLLAGACAGGVGLARVWTEGVPAHEALFWVLAFSSTTLYATTGSVFNLRQRARERRLEAERARAEEVLAESERQRARAERLALAGRLAAGIASDVADPLSTVEARLGALERRVGSASGADPDLPASFADVRAAVQRIRSTVEDLQRFAEADLEAREDCDLAVILADARATLEERFRTSVAVVQDVPVDLPWVHAVRARLVHALVWIMADASGRRVRKLHLAVRQEGAHAIVELDDHAADLALAPMDLPAATVREAGLGLALAREELLRAGCDLEAAVPGGELRMPLRITCDLAAVASSRAAAHVA
jgi:signal transduction histidine kinase